MCIRIIFLTSMGFSRIAHRTLGSCPLVCENYLKLTVSGLLAYLYPIIKLMPMCRDVISRIRLLFSQIAKCINGLWPLTFWKICVINFVRTLFHTAPPSFSNLLIMFMGIKSCTSFTFRQFALGTFNYDPWLINCKYKTGGDCRQGNFLKRSVNFYEKLPFLAEIAQLLYRFWAELLHIWLHLDVFYCRTTPYLYFQWSEMLSVLLRFVFLNKRVHVLTPFLLLHYISLKYTYQCTSSLPIYRYFSSTTFRFFFNRHIFQFAKSWFYAMSDK